jgi:hypothetical protein
MSKHDVAIPIKTKGAIEIIRNRCPELSGKDDKYFMVLIHNAIKKGELEVRRFSSKRLNVFLDFDVQVFAKKLHNKKLHQTEKQLDRQEQLDFDGGLVETADNVKGKNDLYFTITVNNNFQN